MKDKSPFRVRRLRILMCSEENESAGAGTSSGIGGITNHVGHRGSEGYAEIPQRLVGGLHLE